MSTPLQIRSSQRPLTRTLTWRQTIGHQTQRATTLGATATARAAPTKRWRSWHESMAWLLAGHGVPRLLARSDLEQSFTIRSIPSSFVASYLNCDGGYPFEMFWKRRQNCIGPGKCMCRRCGLAVAYLSAEEGSGELLPAQVLGTMGNFDQNRISKNAMPFLEITSKRFSENSPWAPSGVYINDQVPTNRSGLNQKGYQNDASHQLQ